MFLIGKCRVLLPPPRSPGELLAFGNEEFVILFHAETYERTSVGRKKRRENTYPLTPAISTVLSCLFMVPRYSG